MKCEHGQESWCRFCGTIEHAEVEVPEDEKRDYNNVRSSNLHYYYDRLTGKMQDKND